MTNAELSGPDTFPKDNPGPDNAKLLKPMATSLEHLAVLLRGDDVVADVHLGVAIEELRAAIRHYEAMR
jgi:hypothetical protein